MSPLLLSSHHDERFPGGRNGEMCTVLASLKHRQSLAQNEGERTIPLLPCPASSSLLLLWKQQSILHSCGSPRRFPRLLSHLIQKVEGVESKSRPGSDVGDAYMTDSEGGRNQAFVVWLRYFYTPDYSPDNVNPLSPASVIHSSNKYSLSTCYVAGAAGSTAVNWSLHASGQGVFLIRPSVSLLWSYSPQVSCWETCHSHRHGLCAWGEGG